MNNTMFKHDEGDPKYPYLYRGLVEDNNDPQQFGQLRVRVYPMFASLDVEYLPWVRPAFSLFDGSGQGCGSFVVPKIGTYVFVMFEQGDIYQPVYFAEAPTAQKGLPSSRTTNYPNNKVWRTSAGVELSIDDTDHEISIIHPTGTTVTVDSLGKVTVESGNDVSVSGTNVQVDATAKVTVSSPVVNLGDELGGSLVKKTDLLLSQILITAPSGGGPCIVTDPTGLAGTQKVKGS